MLVLPYVILVSVGIVLIQNIEGCSKSGAGNESEETCLGYEALFASVLAVTMICLFCCCFVGCRDREYGSSVERAPMLATEAPPPAMVYAEARAPPDVKTASAAISGPDKYA